MFCLCRRLTNVENVEIFIKAIVTFPLQKEHRKNYDNKYSRVKGVNTFTVADILNEAGTTYSKVLFILQNQKRINNAFFSSKKILHFFKQKQFFCLWK